MEQILSILSKELEKRELSIYKFSKQTGIPKDRVYKWFQGQGSPKSDDTAKIKEWIETEIVDEIPVKGAPHVDEVGQNLSDQGKLVPYYDLDVTAGNFEIFSGENKEQIHSMVRVPSMTDVDAFVNVSGSSMRDKYCSGDIIGIKKINHANFIEWGEAHVVITRDDRRLFKYVRKSKDKDFIVLRSENREENDDIDLPVALVVSMFIVKGLIRRKAM